MAASIAALTAGGGGLQSTSDASGNLNLVSGTTTIVALTSAGVSISGTLAATGVTTLAAGSAAAPAITTTGDTNTGVFFPAANEIAFTVNGVEGVRIDASGNICAGVTAAHAGSRLHIQSSGNTASSVHTVFRNSSSTELLYLLDDGKLNTGTTSGSPFNLTTGDAVNAVVGSDGFLRRSTSSLKYKRDIHPAVHGLADVLKLRPVLYKSKSEADGETVFSGFIAEDVHEAGLTEFVQYAKDGSPDALAYGNMVGLLTKAIQEQQAMITSLTARIVALEQL